ncbi:carbohydrate ABC transporter permease [Paraburkholderia sp. RP-4-7]|jgi:multiple sugar transport system permease protein|uniref:Carbohydrate ABC transporter permease n=1 Tax=Paraburkholderia polaris TaxID=2728848 RepID=A0A848IHA5_9BURK|nr:carbohydrate ABC transporter permease [Paraburkholderia polaris]NML99033.1 carbohydrate ABC transporter permease [Paraburkholderia polaris]
MELSASKISEQSHQSTRSGFRNFTPSFGKLAANVTLLVIGAYFVIPILWLLVGSVDQHAGWQIQMPTLTLDNFIAAMGHGNVQALLNSVIVSTIAAAVSTFAGVLAAYSFSRHHIPWKGPILLAILFLSGVPITILIVPIYKMFSAFGMLSMIPTAVLLGVTSLPFAIYLIKNTIDAIPKDLEEAASMEQASTFRIVRSVVIPLAMPGIASAAIFSFVNAWGNFLIPIVLIADQASQPAPIAIYGFIGAATIRYGQIAAFSVIYSLPVVILYFIMSRFFSGGFSLSGAVRG